jgi:hypothetical protein
MTRFDFEFVVYPHDEHGQELPGAPLRELRKLTSESAARSRAGTLAKRYRGPVDLAHAGAGHWSERYMTTANPSSYHAAGYCFERIKS